MAFNSNMHLSLGLGLSPVCETSLFWWFSTSPLY